MKYLKLTVALSATLLATACSTTRLDPAPVSSPTPAVTKDQTMSAAGKVEAPLTIDLPSWYIKAPASTDDYVWVTGTALSSDLAMSRTKAMLDAQVQLADKLNGLVNALVKQNKTDSEGTVSTDRTQLIVKKLLADVAITGMHLEDSKVMAENRAYRTFVLIRYPMGDANRILRDKLQRERQERDGVDGTTNELDRDVEARRKPVVRATPAPAAGPVSQAPVEVLDVSNTEYKLRRAEAMKNPNAVVEHLTLR
jgi:hypothetical protein